MKKMTEKLSKIQIGVGAFFLFIFMCTVVIQMGCRYAGISATWTEDVTMYSFIWSVFMGGGAMVYEKRHFAFTSLSDMLKNEKVKQALEIVIAVIMLIFSVLMFVYGSYATMRFWNYGWAYIPSFKRGPTWMCVPICGITSAIYLVEQIIEGVGAWKKGGGR